MRPTLTLTERLRQHMEATAKRDEWAQKALDLHAQGKDDEALEAADEAELWDLKVKALEP